MADDDDDKIGRQIVGAMRREIEAAGRAIVGHLQPGAKQLALAAARAAAAEAALHRGPHVALCADDGSLARPYLRSRAYRFHDFGLALDLPRFTLPDFFLSGLRFLSRGLRPGCSLPPLKLLSKP